MGLVNIQDARFLIVDDELPNVFVLERMLAEWECFQVKSTTDPYAVAGIFSEFQPDLVLLDLMMPGLNGFEVLQQLQPLIPDGDYVPILVLTADSTVPAKHRALAEGAHDFLSKPFDMVELSLRVSNLVRTRFLHRQLKDQNHVLDEKVLERTLELAQSEIETVECLALAAEFRDDDTGQHTQRVGHTASLLAEQMGIDKDRVQLIRRAAPLHDVGKIGISDNILLKPGQLTPNEFAAMKAHVTIGAKILARHHTPLLQLASTIALSHHERWDGSGYPYGLMGEDIPLEGRLVAVADVFDALTHERPYKAAWDVGDAVEEIRRQGGQQFDAEVVREFMTLPIDSLL